MINCGNPVIYNQPVDTVDWFVLGKKKPFVPGSANTSDLSTKGLIQFQSLYSVALSAKE